MDNARCATNFYKAVHYLRTEIDVRCDKIMFIELLLALYMNKGPMNQTDLVPYVLSTQTSVSKYWSRLENWGLIQVQQGARRLEATLTSRGTKIVEEMLRILQNEQINHKPSQVPAYIS